MTLQFLEISGIDFNPVDECYAFVQEQPDAFFYKITGTFFVDNKAAVDGELIISEDYLNAILSSCPITFKLVKDNVAYTFSKTTDQERVQLNSWNYKVELLGIIESDAEEDFIYGLVSMKEKKQTVKK